MEYDNLEKYCSAKTVLSTILLNSDTTNILDEYISSYLKLNPTLVSNYITQNGLYHVYMRNDPDPDQQSYPSITELIRSFATELYAKNWIIEHGSNIIYEASKDYIGPLFLMMIYDPNINDYKESFIYDCDLRNYNIKTFIFCEKTYERVIEKIKTYYDDRDINWITLIK